MWHFAWRFEAQFSGSYINNKHLKTNEMKAGDIDKRKKMTKIWRIIKIFGALLPFFDYIFHKCYEYFDIFDWNFRSALYFQFLFLFW